FLSLSTVFSAFGFAGLFHPAATSRVFCSRASPSAQPPSFVRRRFPLAVRARDCCQLSLAPQSTPLDFEALLHAEIRSSETGFRRSFGRSPPHVSPSPGLPPSRRKPGSPGHPLMAFSNEVFTCALAPLVRLQRLASEKVGLPVSRVPARSRF